jgi:hypothetical protein
MAIKPTNSGLITADTAVKTSEGYVYWLTASTESASVVQINDSTDDGGTDIWQIRISDNGHDHIVFNPPLHCGTGIYVDIPAGEPVVALGYI